MKPLKFKHEFVKEILECRKNTTWRLFDDKNLQINDEIELVDAENKENFGKARIIDIQEKSIKDLSVEELNNHQYDNMDKMIESHRKYYGGKVDLDTTVKIITFNLL